MKNSILWTPSQQLAIESTDGDILLSASAGAGKTAVLAHRCVRLLSEGARPCHVEQLLVLTYTESAAAEMRRRIGRVLRERLGGDRRNSHLRRQLALLGRARISTVHAFCRSVLREFFYRSPIDPQFDILDSDESDLLKHQIANQLFEQYYGSLYHHGPGRTFGRFVRAYGLRFDDETLVHRLVQLHNFLDTLAGHQQWRGQWEQQLGLFESHDINRLHLVRRQRRIVGQHLGQIRSQLMLCRQILQTLGQAKAYFDYVDQDLLGPLGELLDRWDEQSPQSLEELAEWVSNIRRLPTLPRTVDKQSVESVKKLIQDSTGRIKEVCRQWIVSPGDLSDQFLAGAPLVNLMLEMQGEFLKRYDQAKRRMNMLDFADLEHHCLTLLSERDEASGGVRPSDAAMQLRRRFRYMLIDEYQDISPLQEQILELINRSGPGATVSSAEGSGAVGNCFMVGDVKQSIFGFRQADHRIILEKYHRFGSLSPGDGQEAERPADGVRIDLNTNFRSRRGIIDGINYIFKRCMTKDFADIEYDAAAQLQFGASCYDEYTDARSKAVECRPIEVHLIERQVDTANDHHDGEQEPSDADGDFESFEDSLAQLDAARREAALVGHRIRQMVGVESGEGEFHVVDPETKDSRPVQYRDIVILLRSMKFNSRLWIEVFQQMGIPAHAEQTTGYFVATEVQDMMSLLSLLDNARQDIALAAVLRSPLVGLSESQLATIRSAYPESAYYQAVMDYAEAGGDVELRGRLSWFLERLSAWRQRARQGDLAELIWMIYRQTHLPAFVRAMPKGRQRYQNLIHLYDRARQFDTFARRGLSRFLRFIEELRDQQGDFGPAPVLTAADNVVRIMSVHKSKGLEFPVVIAAGLANRFNLADQRNPILFNRDGDTPIGLKIIDPVTRDRWDTLARRMIAHESRQRQLAEELRILYVAMTRAREKLILAASVDLDKVRREWSLWRKRAGVALPGFQLDAASCPIDWIGPSLADHPDMSGFFDADAEAERATCPPDQAVMFHVEPYTKDRIFQCVGERDFSRASTKFDWKKAFGADEPAEVLCPSVRSAIDRLNWSYPYRQVIDLAARRSVSELKRGFDPGGDVGFEPDRGFFRSSDLAASEAGASSLADPFFGCPAFTAGGDQAVTPAEVGTWTHLFLQRLKLSETLTEAELNGQLAAMVEQGVFTTKQASHIDMASVGRFFAEPVGKEMLAHRDRLEREWAFTIRLTAGEVYRDVELADQEKDEPVLVRGIIDCWFETDAGLVLVDYKTDRITADQCVARAGLYRVQMQLYRRAMETILDRQVMRGYLYFLSPQIGVAVIDGE